MGKGLLDLEKHFAFYGAYHSNSVNVLIHIFFVWPIFFSSLILFYFTPPLHVPFLGGIDLDLSFFFSLFYAVFYISLIKTPAPSPLSSAFCAGLEADPLLLDSDFLSRGRPGVAIMWCSHCVEDNEVVREPNQDCVYCSVCGKILGCFVYKRHRMSGKPKRNKGLRGRPANIGNLSDFDDLEVAQYLYNEKEKHLRKIIWEEMHKECLQEQAANGASQDRMADGFEELISTQDLEKMVATALVKSRKEKKRKHPTDSKSSTSTTSHRHKLKQKSFNSKINYKALESSYKGNKKKQVAASKIGECENDEIKTIEETRKESEESAVNNVEDLINVDDDNIDNDYYNNEDDGYNENGEDDSYEMPDEDYYDE